MRASVRGTSPPLLVSASRSSFIPFTSSPHARHTKQMTLFAGAAMGAHDRIGVQARRELAPETGVVRIGGGPRLGDDLDARRLHANRQLPGEAKTQCRRVPPRGNLRMGLCEALYRRDHVQDSRWPGAARARLGRRGICHALSLLEPPRTDARPVPASIWSAAAVTASAPNSCHLAALESTGSLF